MLHANGTGQTMLDSQALLQEAEEKFSIRDVPG